MAVCGPADAMRELRALAVRAAVHVQPAVARAVFGAAQVVRLDDERVAFPVADGVALPPRLRFTLRRELSAVEIDVPQAVVGFPLDEQALRVRDVHDLARLRLLMKLEKT